LCGWRLFQPGPHSEKWTHHYAGSQQDQQHYDRGVHIVNGARSGELNRGLISEFVRAMPIHVVPMLFELPVSSSAQQFIESAFTQLNMLEIAQSQRRDV
jgi:hypothetical protein